MPWWLKWHKDIFDYGVLVDYFSTDKSREIIRKICPDWEVRETKNENWDPITNDREFMEIEREFDGYKMVLTTTEFLVGTPNLEDRCIAVPIKRMVDTAPKSVPEPDRPLIEQKKDGYMARRNRHRFLHNYPDGDYLGAGRHKTGHNAVPTKDLEVWKYMYCPWTEEFVNRRLQMKKHMSKRHLDNDNWGQHHKLEKAELEKEYQNALRKIEK